MTTAVLHPKMRLNYFEDDTKWDPAIAVRARKFLDDMYAAYAKIAAPTPSAATNETASAATHTKAKDVSGKTSARFIDDAMSTSRLPTEKFTEIELYISNAYPTDDSDGTLGWWKVSTRNSLLLLSMPLTLSD